MKIVLNESFFAFCIRRRAIKSEFLPFTNRWSSVTVCKYRAISGASISS